MRRFCLALIVLVSMIMGNLPNSAVAGDCCGCNCCCHPVLRGVAHVVRGAARLVTAPIRWIAHHHHCHGCCCDCCNYCDSCCAINGAPAVGPVEPIGPAQQVPATQLPATQGNAAQASYTPVVDADSIEGMSADELRLAAQKAISKGVSLYRQGELEVAREYFAEATTLMPGMAAAWGVRGVAASAAQDSEEACICADHVREITSVDAGERSKLYRTLSPMQGHSRLDFELLVRNDLGRQPAEQIVRRP